ncbi:carbohydrate ABC transporter permease [Halalkalibacter krulwichiae]|uniref:L-arabinose transport system permease protein AraQ n=1 Tax=Halalkalibacter krulwichiae TaxID=199441 RepID=A0A1X9M9Q0_9BACI|nr:carbohydrate ABC transporter permease [Halalkalibacter krulwichiae]ARK30138.1 L-arabinose transport system permease protein AraQ [Halalkalibacter krulwichiae]
MANLAKKQISGQRALILSLSVLLLFMIAPIIYAVLASFKTNMEIFSSPFALPQTWSFDNIISAWHVGNFQQYFFNSAFVTIGGMALVALVACPAGYAFAQLSFRGNNLVFYLILLGMALPVQAIIIPIFYHLRGMGLVDTLTGLTLVSAGLALPFSIFLMRNTFRDVPKELRESAMIDGAGEWKTYWKIMLPLAKPGVVALLIFTFMNIWNDFLLPLVLLMSQQKYTISLGLYSFQGEMATNYALIFGERSLVWFLVLSSI